MTGILLSVRSAAFWLLTLVMTVVLYAVSIPAAWFVKDKKGKQDIYHRSAVLWGRILASAMPAKVDVSGLENIPSGTNAIFAPNHQSYLDIFILFKYLPRPFKFIIMRKLFKVPMLGPHITNAGYLSLDRKDRKKSIHTIHQIIDMVKNGESIVIFPEGVLTRDGSVGDFGRGASIIIQRSKKPVVPVAIDGTFAMLPKGAWRLNASRVSLKFGAPVYFDKYYDEVDKETSVRVGQELREIVVKLKESSQDRQCLKN